MHRNVLITLLLIGSAGTATTLWLHSAAPPAAPPASSNDAAALATSGGLAWRQNNVLFLRLKTGEILSLTDRIMCGDFPCPPFLVNRYRYLGWNEKLVGYRLMLSDDRPHEVFLPFEGDPAFLDPEHTEPPEESPISQPTSPPEVIRDHSLEEWAAHITVSRNQTESPHLSSDKRVTREGDQLNLSLDNNRHFILIDDLVCNQAVCPTQQNFELVGSSPDGRYRLVNQHTNESTATLLINVSTGNVTPLLNIPLFSPDGKWAVSVATDFEQTAPHRLEIFSLIDEKPTLTFFVSANDKDTTAYELGMWQDNQHLTLYRHDWKKTQHIPVILAYNNSAWHFKKTQ